MVKVTFPLPRTALLAASALALAGCAAGPDFKLPRFDLGSGWFQSSGNETAPVLRQDWWKVLGDPVLDHMIDQALTKGSDLRIAAARVRAARAQRMASASAFLPSINADGSASYNESSQNAGTIGPSAQRQTHLFTAGFDASWELDIFGANRRAYEASNAELAAAHADYANARLTLIADVVSAYLDYRLAEERLDLAESSVRSQERTVELTEARFRAGDINGLDAAQARAQMTSTRAQLPLLRQQREIARGVLAILVDQPPTTFTVSNTTTTINEWGLPEIPAGLPSTLLERRPDVITAQNTLHAAIARVGEAQALRLPLFSLTASAGVRSTQLANLLANGSGFWSLAPQASLPLFDAGYRRAVVNARSAEAEAADAQYRKAVLNALREVEANLSAVHEERLRLDDLTKSSASSAQAFSLADALYRAGESNLLPVLQAQEAMFSSQDQRAQSRASLIKNWVALVKSLGGGYGQAKLVSDTAIPAEAPVSGSIPTPVSPSVTPFTANR